MKEEDKYSASEVLMNLPCGLVILENGYRLEMQYHNIEMAKLCGYRPEEFKNRFKNNFMLLIYPEDRSAFERMLEDCQYRMRLTDRNFRLINQDGSIGWGRFQVRFLSLKHTKSVYYCTVDDITISKKREMIIQKKTDDIKRHYRFLSNLYQNVPCGILQCSLEQRPRILDINPRGLAIFGYKEKESFLEKTAGQLFNVFLEEQDGHFPEFDEGKTQFECRFRTEDNKPGWIGGTGQGFIRPDGAKVLQIAFFDITDDKLRDQILHRQQLELEVTYAKLKMAFEQTQLLMWEIDVPTGNIILQEEDARKYHFPKLIKDHLAFTDENQIIHPDFRKRQLEVLKRLRAGESPVEISMVVKGRDQEFHWQKITYTTFKDENGMPKTAIGVAQDQSGEMDALQKYWSEVQYRKVQLKDAIEVLEYDMVTEELKASDLTVIPKGLKKAIPNIRDYLNHLLLNIHPDDIKKMKFLNNYNILVNELEAGKRGEETTVECRISSPSFKYPGYHWMKALFNFTVDIKTKHLIMMVTIWDINKEKIEQIKLQEKAQRDPLTHLWNREAFRLFVDQKLLRIVDGKSYQAFFLMDIDDFKSVNDTYGHGTGDKAICFVADALQSQFRREDAVARLGGDEFVAYMTKVPNMEDVLRKGKQICKSMNGFMDDGRVIPISVSVGIAVAPHHGTVNSVLYEHADRALYYAKSLGKNQCQLFNPHWLEESK
ncbi:MAG: diguanylate cyclase [Eubacteriaceae bacterium]|nr:diguanylate cyclase [Eubacteriaceae bacterium]